MFPANSETEPPVTAVAAETVVAVEADTLTQIEERIFRTVELVNSLRRERDAAVRELAETHGAWEQAEAGNRTLSEELVSLKTERQQVRGRLERLVGHIDQLG